MDVQLNVHLQRLLPLQLNTEACIWLVYASFCFIWSLCHNVIDSLNFRPTLSCCTSVISNTGWFICKLVMYADDMTLFTEVPRCTTQPPNVCSCLESNAISLLGLTVSSDFCKSAVNFWKSKLSEKTSRSTLIVCVWCIMQVAAFNLNKRFPLHINYLSIDRILSGYADEARKTYLNLLCRVLKRTKNLMNFFLQVLDKTWLPSVYFIIITLQTEANVWWKCPKDKIFSRSTRRANPLTYN